MMELECFECGAIFYEDETVTRYEKYDFWGQTHLQPIMTCPNCGSDELEEYFGEEY